MTTQTEALKLAIDRIGNYIERRKSARGIDIESIHAFDLSVDGGFELRLSDLELLKEALAQPAVTESHKQGPVGVTVSMDVSKSDEAEYRIFGRIYEVQENADDVTYLAVEESRNFMQPKQDPVAWWIPKHKAPDMVSKVRWSDECEPLYTTPPPVTESHKRKPLDMTEIVQLTYDIDEDRPATMAELFRFARAIEAAHGINPTDFKE